MTQEKENKVPTSEEILKLHYNMDRDEDGHPVYYDWSAKDAMIAFARLHVEAALEAASEKATQNYSEENVLGESYTINKDSILNAYPLENVK